MLQKRKSLFEESATQDHHIHNENDIFFADFKMKIFRYTTVVIEFSCSNNFGHGIIGWNDKKHKVKHKILNCPHRGQ